MTSRDLDALVTVLRKLDCCQLQGLATAGMLENITIAGMTTNEQIIEQVRTELQEISSMAGRLHCLARLYCWIGGLKDVLSPWNLYRIKPFNVNVMQFNLHRRIALELAMPGHPLVFVPEAAGRHRYACIIVGDTLNTSEHYVVCVCIWNHLRFVAVWASESVARERLRCALASALGGSTEYLWAGSFETLRQAYVVTRCNEVVQQAAP
ncbi:hypothetical protein MRX96_047277 [Rhipicephalus microplus]